MSCAVLPKAAKSVRANQLTRLSCLVLYVKFQFVYIISELLNIRDLAGRQASLSKIPKRDFKTNCT